MRARRNKNLLQSESLEVRLYLSGSDLFEFAEFSSLGFDTQGARLGTSVAISDRFAVLGAPEGLGTNTRSGRVAVFERAQAGTPDDLTDDFWRLQAEIPSPIDQPGQAFGTAVAIHNETIFVGAPGNIIGSDAGRVFTFDLQDESWIHDQTLIGPSAGTTETFGSTLTVNGSYLVVGSPFSQASTFRAGTVDVFQPVDGQWNHSWRLFGQSPTDGDAFGASLSLDGDRLAVGEPGDDAQATDSGSVEIFESGGGAWFRVDVLKADSPGFRDRLGSAVSLDGSSLAAGAPGRKVSEVEAAGTVIAFDGSGNSWTESALINPDSPIADAGFGTAVSLVDGRLLVGAPNDSTGATFAYRNDGTDWLTEPQLEPNGRNGDLFGSAIAQTEHFAVVGVPSFDVAAAETGSGVTYHRSSDSWQLTPDSRLRAASEFGRFEANFDNAGRSVAMTDDLVVIGIPDRDLQRRRNVGQVLVYARDDNGTPEVFDDTWSDVTVLTSPRPGPNDQFGYAVAVHGDTIVVGAPGEDVGELDSGAAYVFRNVNSQWQHTQTLDGEAEEEGNRFGAAIAMTSSTLAIGAPGWSVPGFFNMGAVGVFELHDDEWAGESRLTPLQPVKAALFGYSIDIDGDTIAVGMPLRDQPGNQDAGAVATFTRSGTTWVGTEVPPLPGQEVHDRFGESVLLNGGELFVGSPGWDGSGRDEGRVGRYELIDGEWNVLEAIESPAASSDARFGASLANADESVWVGSPGGGLATLYSEIAGAFDATGSLSGPADFGASIAASGSVLLAGAPGASGSGLASGAAKLFAEVPAPEITVTDVSATEDDAEIVFSVVRNHSFGEPAITVTTVEGTAQADSDFAELNSQRIEYSDRGQLEKEIHVFLESDELVEGDETFDLVLTDAVFADLIRTRATATIIDNDTPQFVVGQTGGSTEAAEGQAPDTISVRLTSQPQTPVVITVSHETPARFAVDASSFTFDSGNWDQPQTLSVRALDDDVATGNSTAAIEFAVDQAQSDPQFAGLAPREISVVIIDDDAAGIDVTESDGITRVSETGTRDTFDIKLTSRPTGDVVVLVEPSVDGEVLVENPVLTFTSGNWDVPQTVEVVGLDDDVVDGTQLVDTTISVQPDTQADEYLHADSVGITVRNLDFELDFGSAPSDLYPVTLAENAARHQVKSHLFLGSGISAESDAVTNGQESNDGAKLTGAVQGGAMVNAVFEPSAAGFISLWIDLNHDGDWNDFGEHILSERVEEAGRVVIPVRLPVAGFSGDTYARARFSSRLVSSPYGEARDGEVEDFVVTLKERPRGIADEFEVGVSVVDLNVLANDQTNSPTELKAVSDSDDARISIENNRLRFDANNSFSGDVRLTYNATGLLQSLATDRLTNRSEYGQTIAIDGDMAVIGAPGYRGDRGIVDVYRRNRDGWEFEQRLIAETREADDRFGDSVAISGNTIVVGSPSAGSGEVTIFERPNQNWVRTDTISLEDNIDNAGFGAALSLDHNSLFVGSPFGENSSGVNAGIVFEFQRDENGQWGQVAAIEPIDGADNDQFGSTIYRDHEHLVVGAPKADIRGNASGAVYAYRHNGTAWIQRQRLTPAGKADHFGFAIAGSGNTIAISAPLDDDAGLNHGAVWLFERNPSSGRYSKLAILHAAEPTERARFGESLAMEGDTLLVASKQEEAPVAVFQREDGLWNQKRTVIGGASVALSHGMALFGDPASDVFRPDGGDVLFADLNEFSAEVLIRVR